MSENNPNLSYKFPWQKKDEEVKMLIRGFLPSLLIPVFMIAGGFFIPAMLVMYFLERQWLYITYQELINSVMLLWLGVGIFWIIYLVYEWFFDVCVITNQRIIDIDQQGFFAQKASEAGLSKVQDVVYEIRGLLKTLLNFGDVTVYTAGSDEGFTFENVHEPQKVHQKLLSIIESYSDGQETPLTTRELFEYFKEQRREFDKRDSQEIKGNETINDTGKLDSEENDQENN